MSLTTDALEVRYGETVVVRPQSLALGPGELIGLIGPNGAGKTSLMKALAGIPRASARVAWQGRPLAARTGRERARMIAYLAQSPETGWPLTVAELVALGRLPHRRFGESLQSTDREAIADAMSRTGIEALAGRPIDRLSGGERMRAHLARAFAVDAPVLLVDEPVASLDPWHQLNVMRLLADYAAAGRLVVAVLHDLNLALGHCTRILLMNDGEIVADGEPEAALDDAAFARHYRIRAWLGEHEGRRIAVPWEMLDRHD